MPKQKLRPTKTHPLPYDPEGEARASRPTTRLGKIAAASATAHAVRALRPRSTRPPDLTKAEFDAAQDALEEALTDGKVEGLDSQPIAALAASAFLEAYGTSLALNAAQVRVALTNKLLALANCGDARYELRAIELLGKHNDINLFTERSEVNINYTTSEGLEAAIKERVKRLLLVDHTTADDVYYPSLDPLADEDEDEEEIEEGEFTPVVLHAAPPTNDLTVWQEPPQAAPSESALDDDEPDFDWSSPFDE
jgi:hypothetical protein